MTPTTKSIPMKPAITHELYLKGSSNKTTVLQIADYKVLEITGSHINVISPVFQVSYSGVLIDKKTNILTYWDGALEKTVDLNRLDKIMKFVKIFFRIDNDRYFWKEVSSEPKEQGSLQDLHNMELARNLPHVRAGSNDSWMEDFLSIPVPKCLATDSRIRALREEVMQVKKARQAENKAKEMRKAMRAIWDKEAAQAKNKARDAFLKNLVWTQKDRIAACNPQKYKTVTMLIWQAQLKKTTQQAQKKLKKTGLVKSWRRSLMQTHVQDKRWL